jgi:hypothetical protein
MLVGADAPTGMGEDSGMGEGSLVIMRVDPLKSAGNGSSGERGGGDLPEKRRGNRPPRREGEHSPASPTPVRGGDQRSVLSRWAEERQGLRQPDAGDVEEPAEMERQVRDQLYGPGFRRR